MKSLSIHIPRPGSFHPACSRLWSLGHINCLLIRQPLICPTPCIQKMNFSTTTWPVICTHTPTVKWWWEIANRFVNVNGQRMCLRLYASLVTEMVIHTIWVPFCWLFSNHSRRLHAFSAVWSQPGYDSLWLLQQGVGLVGRGELIVLACERGIAHTHTHTFI